MDSSNSPTLPPPVASSGLKRPAPTLLPPFEPLSSSPGLPRPAKRCNTGHAHLKYPTPVPTSSTGIMSSSPPLRRPGLGLAATERAPLSAVPAVELSENGETLMMGRSSNSSHYQLSSNRLISRVHVKARFIAATSPLDPNKIEIVCNGWNGLKLHCQGRTWELFKGDSFTSETEGTEVMVDVQDARILIQWPRRGADALANLSDSSWEDSPTRGNDFLQSSPLRHAARITSPESPTANLSSSRRLQALLPSPQRAIKIYEDEEEPELPEPKRESVADINVSMRSEVTASFTSDFSDAGDENDPDEENDPIVHSFGPFGADIAGRLASITTKSSRPFKPTKSALRMGFEPLIPRDTPSFPASPTKKTFQAEPAQSSPPVAPSPTPESPKKSIEIDPAIPNHVINQLAFSRLASTPLSTIMHNLPSEEKKDLSKDTLRMVIESTACIGVIERQGKDAAGKPLESEYYYIADNDEDMQRRAAVEGLSKPSLRACRKQHKQYYWKRPRTP